MAWLQRRMSFLLLDNCCTVDWTSHFYRTNSQNLPQTQILLLLLILYANSQTILSIELICSIIDVVLSLPYSLPDVTNNKVERGKVTSVKVFTALSFKNLVWFLLFSWWPGGSIWGVNTVITQMSLHVEYFKWIQEPRVVCGLFLDVKSSTHPFIPSSAAFPASTSFLQ